MRQLIRYAGWEKPDSKHTAPRKALAMFRIAKMDTADIASQMNVREATVVRWLDEMRNAERIAMGKGLA